MRVLQSIPVDGRRLPGTTPRQSREITRAALAVRRRTGCTGWYFRGKVTWVRGADPSRGGPHRDVVFQGRTYLPIDVTRTVRNINFAKMSRAAKKRDVQRQEQAVRDRRLDDALAFGRDVASEFKSRMAYVNRLLEHGKRSRPSILVSG